MRTIPNEDYNVSIPYMELDNTSLPFDVSTLSFENSKDVYSEAPHRHNFQEIIWITRGSGEHVIDDSVIEIKEKTLYLIQQGEIHYFTKGVGISGYLIRFSDEFLQNEPYFLGQPTLGHSLYSLFADQKEIFLDDVDFSRLEKTVILMVNEFIQIEENSIEILRHYLSAFLLQLDRINKNTVESVSTLSTNKHLYTNFLLLLNDNFKKLQQVKDYANLLAISERKLTDIVKENTGKTAKTVVLERVIVEAKRYLNYSTNSTKEIAFELGFNDPSYFSKIFTQIVGVSPKKFRSRKV